MHGQATLSTSVSTSVSTSYRSYLIVFCLAGCFLSLFISRKPLVAAQTKQENPPILRVVTKPLPPFMMKQNEQLIGFSIDLWDEIAKRLDLKFEWVEVKTVKEVLETIESGKADLGIAGISITQEREKRFDFSYPIFHAGLQIMVAENSQISFFRPFALLFSPAVLEILAVAFLIIIILAHIMWFVERGKNPDFPHPYWSGVTEAMWWAIVSLITVDFGYKSPNQTVGRFLAVIWMVVSLVLIAMFTARITSDLTVQQLQGNINRLADLQGKKVATVADSTSAKYLSKFPINLVAVQKIDDAYPLLERGEVEAIIYDAPVLRYYLMGAGRGKYRLAGSMFHLEEYGIALPPDSPYLEAINEALLGMIEDGTYQVIYEQWFGAESSDLVVLSPSL